jgi:hypothetical protein
MKTWLNFSAIALVACVGMFVALLLGGGWTQSAHGQQSNGNKPQTRTYKVSHVCDTDSRLKITEVKITADETVVTLVFTADMDTIVRTAPPGHKEAFFLRHPKSKKKFDLLNVSGIAITPQCTYVRKGTQISFSLTLERIDDSMDSFHLIEGEVEPTPDPVTGVPFISWKFMNVKFR